jgi:CheY-like chemotaxis protein
MKILIVEDDKYKSDAIIEYLNSNLEDLIIETADSLSSGLFILMDKSDFDLIILDMSMPSFDITEKDPAGGNPESYAGEDFLSQMTLMGIETPVVVVTQYDNFGSDEKLITLKKLTDKLSIDHGDNFKGSVYFNATSNSWKKELLEKIFEQGLR